MIKKRTNGIWRLDVKLPDGRRCRDSLGTVDKAEALTKAPAALQKAIDKATLEASTPKTAKALTGPTLTLDAAFKKAMRDHPAWRDSKSKRTLDENFALITSSAQFAATDDLTKVTHAVVLDYVNTLRAAGTSASTINQRLSLLSVILTQAAAHWGYREITPFKMPRAKITQGRIRVLSQHEEDEMIRVLKAGTGKYHFDMSELVPCLLDTGCRLSEMLQLEPRDVDWAAGSLTIWKNKADLPRSIPMTQRLRSILESRKEQRTFFEGLTVDNSDDAWAWGRTQLRMTSDKEYVIHALRHTTASRLAAAGMDAFRIQKWMGHKNIATTMLYVTLFANDLKELAGALERSPAAVPNSVPNRGSDLNISNRSIL